MKKKRVALIYGGKGAEHDVSVKGAKNLMDLIDRDRFIPYPVLIDRRGVWHGGADRSNSVYPVPTRGRGVLSSSIGNIPIDVAFPLLHGEWGEDGTVQGALECAGIPYVGCDVLAGAVCADKILTKQIAHSLGIPTVRGIFLTVPTPTSLARAVAEEEIGYPMFIKPSGLGSSVGCSLVRYPGEFTVAYETAVSLGTRILIEEYKEGARELECSYLNSPTRGEIFTPPGEIFARGVYTYKEKYARGSTATASPRAKLPGQIAERAVSISRELVRAIGIRQIARIDFFLSDGELLLNEINTMPGFTSKSLYPAMIESVGISPTELVTELIEGAL